MVCSVWYSMYCLVYSVWYVYGMYCLVYSVWYIVYSVWYSMVCLLCSVCYVVCGKYCLVYI